MRPSRSCPTSRFALLIAAVPIGLVMLQPDLGTAVVMGMIVLGILAVAGTRLSWLAGAARRSESWRRLPRRPGRCPRPVPDRPVAGVRQP